MTKNYRGFRKKLLKFVTEVWSYPNYKQENSYIMFKKREEKNRNRQLSPAFNYFLDNICDSIRTG